MVCFLSLLDLMKDIHFATFFDTQKNIYGSPLKVSGERERERNFIMK